MTVIYNYVSFHTQQSEINQVFFCIFISGGDLVGGEGGQGGCLASAAGIWSAVKESRGVWHQYVFILSCGEFGGILISAD